MKIQDREYNEKMFNDGVWSKSGARHNSDIDGFSAPFM
jgi:hypothetical protein